MEKKFKLLPPMMPNFLPYETSPRPRQEGFKPNENRIPVSDLSESEAIEYGELMKQTFIKHWKQKVTNRP